MQNTENFKKPFKKFDILIYSVLLLLVCGLFLFALGKGEEKGKGLQIYVDNNLVASLDFSLQKLSVEAGYENQIKMVDNQIEINTQFGYNLLAVDFENKNAVVIQTNCGFSKECTFMSLKGGVICCAPHRLVIKSAQHGDVIIIK